MTFKKLLLASFEFIFLAVFILLAPSYIYSASIQMNPIVTDLDSYDDEYTVDVNFSISMKNGTIYYLRGVFYKEGTNNYCGYTWNNNEWYNGPYTTNEGWKKFFQIEINNSSWSGELKAKLDNTSSACNESGIYKFKIQRFTASGTPVFDTQEAQTIEVLLPVPTDTPYPTFTPTPTLTPIPTITPTKVPIPTKTPTPMKTPTPTQSKTDLTKIPTIPINKITPSVIPSTILGESTESANFTPTPTERLKFTTEEIVSQSQKKDVPGILLVGGGIVMIFCGILFYRKYKNSSNNEE